MQNSDFINYLKNCAKPRHEFRLGVEAEVFGFDAKTLQRLDKWQVQEVLARIAESEKAVHFEENLLVETQMKDGGKFTVEPGGQLEFSSAPRKSLTEIETDLRQNFLKLRAAGEEFGFKFVALGFDPLHSIDEQNWFMKPRYRLMKPYLATCGKRAWDMMTRTCSIQVNLDFSDEADLGKKFIAANRLSPIVSAIFANSPFREGKVSDFKSNRVLTWLETDNARCGVSQMALENDFSLEKFVEYILDVPMLFVRREKYLTQFAGATFREFLGNKEIEPIFQDFTDHLTAVFTEARIKNYLEIRCADGGNLAHSLAVCALWKGLLYDAETLDETLKIAPKLNAEEFQRLFRCVAKNALQAERGEVLQTAKTLVELAVSGLQKIAPDEVKYLEILRENVLEKEVSPGDLRLENFDGDFVKMLDELRFC